MKKEVIQTLSIHLKAQGLSDDFREQLVKACVDAKERYNKMAVQICDICGKMTIGEFYYKYLECNKGKSDSYMDNFIRPEWKDKKVIYIFSKNFYTNSKGGTRGQVLKSCFNHAFKKTELYSPDVFGIGNCRDTIVSNVVKDFSNKFDKFKIGIKQVDITNDSDEDMILLQCIYEIQKNSTLEGNTGWENKLKEFKSAKENLAEDENKRLAKIEKKIERFKILSDYFKSNKNKVLEEMDRIKVEEYTKNGGCVCSSEKLIYTFQLSSYPFEINRIEGTPKYNLRFRYGSFKLCGHKGLIKGSYVHDGTYRLNSKGKLVKNMTWDCKNEKVLVNLEEVVSRTNLSFIIEGNNIFVKLVVNVPFTKSEIKTDKVVGIDVNTKHAICTTSLNKSDYMEGYPDVMGRLLQNSDFVKGYNKAFPGIDIDMLYKNIVFAPIEFKLLETRLKDFDYQYDRKTDTVNNPPSDINNVDYQNWLIKRRLENMYNDTLDAMKQEYIDSNDIMCVKYIESLKMLRSKLKSKEYLRINLYYKQSEFDKNPENSKKVYKNTEEGVKEYQKINSIQNDINGCKNNIISFAYKFFEKHNINICVFEDIDTAHFDKKYSKLKLPNSFIKYYEIKNCTIEEVKDKLSDKKESFEDFQTKYDFIFDKNHRLVNMVYKKHVLDEKIRLDMNYNVQSDIKMADIKNDFVRLWNHGKVAVAFAPAAYSSQIDSSDGKLPCLCDSKGKKIAPKNYRRSQEEFKIGDIENADINAANNIADYINNPLKTQKFLEINKESDKYGKVAYKVKKSMNSPKKVLNEYLKNEEFCKCVKA